MIEFERFTDTLTTTVLDVVPIAVIIFGFQFAILRKPITNPLKVLLGFGYVIIGLALFLIGLDLALFPLGETMATQLTEPAFLQAVRISIGQQLEWVDYYWVYLFAFFIGFSTTIAEPSLIAVIVVGDPIHYYIIAGYIIVVIQTYFAPRMIIPLAYDSGGVTTSTVTVPLVAALGLGLASTVPGRSPLIDGFGLIAFASLFPMISVMGYAQITQWFNRRYSSQEDDDAI